MKAVVYHQYGGLDELTTEELPRPRSARDKAVIRMKTMALNPRDTGIRKGKLKIVSGFRFPKKTGCDFSGVVEEVGPNTHGISEGDELFGYHEPSGDGVSAEYVRVSLGMVAKKPQELSHTEAATLGCAYLTAKQAMQDEAQLEAGDHLLVYGASGGVGTAALQLGAMMDLEMTAVSHSSNEAYCRDQGAHHFIAYDKSDPFEGDSRYDCFFQIYSDAGLQYGSGKSLVVSGGSYITLIPNPLYKMKSLFGGPRLIPIIVSAVPEDLRYLAEKTVEGDLAPHVDRSFHFDQCKEAYRYFEQERIQGKVVVTFG